MLESDFDPFWKTEKGGIIYRGVPVALPGREFGLNQRLSVLKGVNYGDKILSIGCGIAADLKTIKEKECITLGLDPSRKFLNEGNKAHNADNLVQAIGEHLPLKEGSFDLVLLFEVLEHVIAPNIAIKEINRILKPGGLLFLTVPNRFFFFETHGIRICNTSIDNLGGIGIPFFSMLPNYIRRKYERARIYHQAEVVSLLKNNGFNSLKIEYLMPPLDILNKNAFVLTARKLLLQLSKIDIVKMIGANIMILSKKSS